MAQDSRPYLVVEICKDLGVVAGHDGGIKPGVISSSNETLGCYFAGSAYLQGIVVSSQDYGPFGEIFDVAISNELDDNCT